MTPTVTTLQMTDRTLAGNGIQVGVREPTRQSDERERPNGIDVEITNRLRNLGRDSGMVEVAECRSRFSSMGIEQVRIRMRLKQVTGLVSG